MDWAGIEEIREATQFKDAPSACHWGSQRQRPRPFSEQFAGPDDDADSGRPHELDIAQVDHEIRVVKSDCPRHGLGERSFGGSIMLTSKPDNRMIGVQAGEQRYILARDDQGRRMKNKSEPLHSPGIGRNE